MSWFIPYGNTGLFLLVFALLLKITLNDAVWDSVFVGLNVSITSNNGAIL